MITDNFSIKVIRINLDKSIIRSNNRYRHKKFLQRYIDYFMYRRLKLFLPFATGLRALTLLISYFLNYKRKNVCSHYYSMTIIIKNYNKY